MPEITLIDALLVETPSGEREWSCVVEVDGTPIAYTFPEDTVAIRCAEYGFDPDLDADEVLDLVLGEPFHTDPPGLVRDPRHLHNNPDRDDARAYLRQRTAGRTEVRSRARRPGGDRPPMLPDAVVLLDQDVEPGTALDVLRRSTPRRSERAAEVGAQLDRLRGALKAGQDRPPAETAGERAGP